MKNEDQKVEGERVRVHPVDRPYCNDLACMCHTNTLYHDVLHHPVYSHAEIAQAYRFYGLAFREVSVWHT